MTLSAENLRELRSLTAKLHEGRLTDEESLRLKSQLTASAESRQIFSTYTAMVALLEVELPTMKHLDGDVLAAENADQDAESLQSLDLDIREPVNSSPHRAGLFFTAFQNSVTFFSQEVPFALLVATVLTSLGLWGASLVYVSQPNQVVKNHKASLPATALPSEREHVGCITNMVGVKWGSENPGNSRLPTISEADWKAGTKNNPSPIALGDKFALASGLIEISYDTGAKVILQGPCLYEVDSREGGFLTVGKLTARLEKKRPGVRGQRSEAINQKSLAPSPQPQPALTLTLSQRERGPNTNPKSLINKSQISSPSSPAPRPQSPAPAFAVRTPTATVTDLGTEFGVEVQPSGLTSTYVFQGIVEMRSNAKGSSPVRLTAQESGQVDGNDVASNTIVHRTKNIDPTLFVRSEQLWKQANAVESDREMTSFHRWQIYSQKLRRDPSLVAYYDFQQQKDQPALLANVAEGTRGTRNGVVNGAIWTEGRMPDKQALLFHNPNDHVRIELSQKIEDLTLATWIYLDTLGEGRTISGLLMSENLDLHWQIANWNGHVSFNTPMTDNIMSWEIFQNYRLRQWMHLVCTCDHSKSQVRFYANGNSVGEVDCQVGQPFMVGPVWIGNWKGEVRCLHGKMDELAIFKRPFSHEEVRRMYKSEKP